MRRLAPFAGIILALLIGVAASLFSNRAVVTRTADTSSPTLSTAQNPAPAQTDLPNTAPSGATTTLPKKPAPVPAKQTASAPVPTTPVAPAAPPQNQDFTNATAAVRAALVNIICLAPPGSNLHSISGSGVIIDSKGYVLTNAHVAQYFLLADKNVSCTIRTGSPATDAYTASIAFLSPNWVSDNASLLTQQSPSGTGQYDFAILAITGSATAAPLPAVFSSIPLASNPPTDNTPVVIASYGAQFLDAMQIESSLFPTIVLGSVKDIFTFGVNTIDVISLGGSAAAQEGSSGGGVANANGQLVGTITTSTTQGATADRTLNAITASYVRGEYASETGSALDLLLADTPSATVAAFGPQAQALEAMLKAAISN